MEDGDGGPAASPSSMVLDTGIDEEDQLPRCTKRDCRKDNDDNMIECKPCGKYTHFACTRLPPSQLQRFMTKGYKRYVCEGCYSKDHEVHEDYIRNSFEREWTERERELLEEIEKLKSCVEKSNDETATIEVKLVDFKNENRDLMTRIKSLEGENERSEHRLRIQGKMIHCVNNLQPNQKDQMMT